MNFSDYKSHITADTLMGPNSARLLEELLQKFPLSLSADSIVLDLGCGKGLTSLIIARETGAKVYANDLWISAEDNQKRFEAWGMGKQILPVCEDANHLNFEEKLFDALFSIDAYHYFATAPGFFTDKILPFLKDQAVVLIGIPGIKNEYAGLSDELLADWLGNEAYMFKSPKEWKEIIGHHERIESVETFEMDCFDLAWNEWFETKHRFAIGDQQFFESMIRPYTCFVGICIRLK